MASSSGKGKVAVLFTEGVLSSAEGEVAIDETASRVSIAPNVCVATGVSVAVREGEECVEEFVDQMSGGKSFARLFVLEREADYNDTFVHIMSSITAVGDADSEGWTFANALARSNLSVETLADGVVDTSRLPTCESSFLFPISF